MCGRHMWQAYLGEKERGEQKKKIVAEKSSNLGVYFVKQILFPEKVEIGLDEQSAIDVLS